MTLLFLHGDSHGQRSLAGYTVHRIVESNTTKVTEHTLSMLYISFYFPTPVLN